MISNSKIVLIAIITSLLFGDRPYAVVLGIAQDGGAPHAGCEKLCCTSLLDSNKKEKVSCLGIVDPVKVTRTALQNAASCAGTLITTNYGIIQTEDK